MKPLRSAIRFVFISTFYVGRSMFDVRFWTLPGKKMAPIQIILLLYAYSA